ncbi:hypothetical protein NECAME_01470, partial [Necator americanus]
MQHHSQKKEVAQISAALLKTLTTINAIQLTALKRFSCWLRTWLSWWIPYVRATTKNDFCQLLMRFGETARNSRFFLASSQLLASMSSFSYMRPVWKKTTLELLLDSSFFKMDMQSLRQWLIVTDHLMTHDKTSFKDLLKSIAYTPNASFSIMTSKEQEYEARAQAVKRLAFVVLGSELDQYQAQMNDIQERLSENLRVSQSPSIRS